MSNYGPRPLDPAVRFWAKVEPRSSGCWEWTGATGPFGYGLFRVNNPRRQVHAHRWLWEHLYGPTDLWVLHRCDNPPCIRPSHLFVGTRQDNVDDARVKGRYPHGEAHYTKRIPRRRDRLGRFGRDE